MNRARLALVVFTLIATCGIAAADTESFVIRLGRDTVAVERCTRTATRVQVDQVGRSPRVMNRSFVYDYGGRVLANLHMVVTPAGATAPTQTVDVARDIDSLTVTTTAGTDAPRVTRVALAPDGMILTSSSPWAAYETQLMRLAHGTADSLHVTAWYVGAPEPLWFGFRRLGADSAAIYDQRGSLYHARVDPSGHVLGVLPIAGTAKFSVVRVADLDLAALAAAFTARERADGALGALSPRDTVRAGNAGGASLWVDYGRPAKRGREIFGNVVPYGEVWRTGANAATQFRTDKALDFGGTIVPAGLYTLWTLPTTTGWKLIVNSETGQWGTEHHADKDLFTIGMKSSTLPGVVERFTIGVEPSAHGGTLNLDWDRTRASAAFTVVP